MIDHPQRIQIVGTLNALLRDVGAIAAAQQAKDGGVAVVVSAGPRGPTHVTGVLMPDELDRYDDVALVVALATWRMREAVARLPLPTPLQDLPGSGWRDPSPQQRSEALRAVIDLMRIVTPKLLTANLLVREADVLACYLAGKPAGKEASDV